MSKEKIELVNVTEGVINTYRNWIKNNKNDSVNLIKMKLTRNILVGKFLYKSGNCDVYGYGCLRIFLQRDTNTVTYLKNYREPIDINRELKDKLDKELGIIESGLVSKVKKLLKVG